MNIYLELTRQFNQERLRAVLAGGQAAVLHRLAMMSKDGDWILREDEETIQQLLYSRSARDLIVLAEKHSQRIKALEPQRPLLGVVHRGVAELEIALDAERR
jgi:hypothetical protein